MILKTMMILYATLMTLSSCSQSDPEILVDKPNRFNATYSIYKDSTGLHWFEMCSNFVCCNDLIGTPRPKCYWIGREDYAPRASKVLSD